MDDLGVPSFTGKSPCILGSFNPSQIPTVCRSGHSCPKGWPAVVNGCRSNSGTNENQCGERRGPENEGPQSAVDVLRT